jgi:hypothetical protein
MTTTPTEPTYKDAKAQAKAAKAYAKAQRPYYKKKRVIIPAAILGVAVLSQAASGGESGSEAKAVSDKGAASAAKDAGSAPKDAGSSQDTFEVGQAVELEGTQYTVTGVSTQGNIGGQFGENADGEFVVVDLTIENKKDETKTFLDSAATFHAGDGTSYQGSNAAIYLGDDSLFLREMQPDLPTKGKLVFDLPPAKIAGGVLVVEDLFGGGEARIDLGLK